MFKTQGFAISLHEKENGFNTAYLAQLFSYCILQKGPIQNYVLPFEAVQNNPSRKCLT